MNFSIWEKETFFAPKDVIIIGSGFVGLWSAYHLKKHQPDLRVTIVDRGLIPTGASTRNAGFACFGSVTELMRDLHDAGENQMLETVEMRFRGLSSILKTFSKKEIGWEQRGGYELITGAQYEKAEALKEDIHLLNKMLRPITGRKHVFGTDETLLHKFGFAGVDRMIVNDLEAQLHAAKLLLALQKKVQALDVSILHNVEIVNFERSAKQIRLHTTLSPDLVADKVLICTNAFAKELVPELDVEPARGQVIVTSPIHNLPFSGCFHFDAGYYYFRDIGNRVLLGGARNMAFEEEHTHHFGTTDKIQDELKRFLHENILPGKKFSIDHQWSGIMGMGKEKTPIIRKIKKNIYCAVRMSGMGVAIAPVVGEKVAKLMLD